MLICFFDSEEIVHTEFVPQGHTVNQFYYRTDGTACTEPRCLYKGALYLYLTYFIAFSKLVVTSRIRQRTESIVIVVFCICLT